MKLFDFMITISLKGFGAGSTSLISRTHPALKEPFLSKLFAHLIKECIRV